eukprot:16147821-Heterocapsa_arctica.AAC.1
MPLHRSHFGTNSSPPPPRAPDHARLACRAAALEGRGGGSDAEAAGVAPCAGPRTCAPLGGAEAARGRAEGLGPD